MSELLALAEDFDQWRARYDDLSFDEQKQIYERIRELYPNQRHATLERAYPFFDRYKPETVVELGGWDGWLATCALGQHPEIKRWWNYDLVEVPQTCIDKRYALKVLERPFWAHYRAADAFVATHTIEHVKAVELEKIVDSLTVECCLIEAPIERRPRTWEGYCGTHVLEVGWDAVDEMFEKQGFKVDEAWGFGRYYAR
jgi:hypothetical protein